MVATVVMVDQAVVELFPTQHQTLVELETLEVIHHQKVLMVEATVEMLQAHILLAAVVEPAQ
jgi:hypothetical protein